MLELKRRHVLVAKVETAAGSPEFVFPFMRLECLAPAQILPLLKLVYADFLRSRKSSVTNISIIRIIRSPELRFFTYP